MWVEAFEYLNVRNFDNEAEVQILLVTFITLPEQLCAGEGNNTLVRTILERIRFDVP